jgi:leucyl-tRNA synthetase
LKKNEKWDKIKNMDNKYNLAKIESKWQKYWQKEGLYKPDLDKAKRPFYNLMMFPYPSAEGLHVGNMYAFVHSDAYGRFMRLKGYDVFEPIGLDGFGIHSENYAIKIKEHIRDVSERTEKHFYEQLHMIGNGYDWTRTVETYKPNYYKWTQWLFLKMYEKGLAVRKKSLVNWCPSCKTVLSDEQIINNHCERCGTLTKKKEMEQWFWKITDYAERLLKNLDWINWSEEVKTIQKNWIGKSQGAEIKFLILNSESLIKVFTTRLDTIFGCTYLILAPEHEIISKLKPQIKNWKEVEKYIQESGKKTEIDRTAEKNKTGVEIKGVKIINPFNSEELPLYVADYVLAQYGTGAVMAVPAHDKRDFEFTKKYKLETREVVKSLDKKSDVSGGIFVDDGILINSQEYNGLKSEEARKRMTQWLSKNKLGGKKINYKLRDWCVSRQRYWGPPIPMIDCPKCGWVPVPEKDLPVLLPDMDDFLPDGSGKGPLNKIAKFVNTTCPKCNGKAQRETDVSDPFVDSSWYYLRYLSTDFNDQALDKKRLKKWMPVDMYIGGKEHSVLHLLYSRFVTMVMFELGYVPKEEPFLKFRAHGLLIKDSAKMSKSKGNIINPDEYIAKFGADTVRLYLMFLGDMRQGGDWRDSGIAGMQRFVVRIWNAQEKITDKDRLGNLAHKITKGVEDDMNNLKYNTAIAKLMILTNKIYKSGCSKKEWEKLLVMMSPFAPHITEELWNRLGNKESIFLEAWPKYDPKLIHDQKIELVVQVNGKVRDKINVNADISEEEARKVVLKSAKIKNHIAGKKIKKVIFVKGKLVSIVI